MIYKKLREIVFAKNIHRLSFMESSLMCTCITLRKNEVIAIGMNKRKFNKLVAKYRYPTYRQYTLHAELDALIKSFNKQKYFDTMMIYRGLRGNLNSKPCIYCTQWIRKLNVNVVYTIDDQIITTYSKKLIGYASYKEIMLNHTERFKELLVTSEVDDDNPVFTW